jgi:TetR/AcrR family transcriptional regulator of autoinduction and epiphytic fitness
MTPAPRLTDLKRDAILRAAIEEFRAHGFEATSMDRIAARAEVSKRTVYNHFPSKDELFAEILAQLWESSVAQLSLPYRADRPLREQLRELLRAKMRMLNDSNFRDLARVAIAATIHSPERAGEMVARLSAREEGVTLWIRAAQADGRLKAGDPVFAAQQLQGLLKAFAFWPQVTLGQPPLDEATQAKVVDATADLFLAHHAR